jgi:hypothetical protein
MTLFAIGLLSLAACHHTENFIREMTWSTEKNSVGLRTLPEGTIRLTFVQAPKFHVALSFPGLKEHLEKAEKGEVPVLFEIQCKHRQLAMLRIRSVAGIVVQSGPSNMWMESASVVPGQDLGPFPDVCRY